MQRQELYLIILDVVVVDRREDKDCDTGRFELAYKQVREVVGALSQRLMLIQRGPKPPSRSNTGYELRNFVCFSAAKA